MLTALLLLAPASAERWYYPDASDRTEPVPASWALTGAVMIGLEEPGILPQHPDIAAAEWLTRRPAVAVLTLHDGADPVAVSAELHARDTVRWSHPDFVLPLTLHTLPDDPYVGSQWHLENTGQAGSVGADINAEAAWAHATGAGQLISIIDSGVDADHPDLDATSGYDYVDGDDDSYPADDNAHGTACAGLAAGIGNNGEGIAGVAYDAAVYGIRFIGSNSSSAFYGAFTESVDAGATVLSNSWGTTAACDGFSLPASYTAALDYGEESGRDGLGSVIVFAAGNDSCDVSGDGFLSHEFVVGVAALSSSDVRESYSSYGDTVDISAPSGGLVTTDISGETGYGSYSGDNNYTGSMSGTSASTPLVAGVFALMFSANERLTAADARTILCQTATRNDIPDADFDETGWSPYYGCGRVDAGAAVAAVANVAPGAPASAMPTDTVYADRIWLDWSAAVDDDGDPLTYRVQWWADDGAVSQELVDGLSLEVTGSAEAGQTLTWQVAAVDLWGDGPWSTPEDLSVIARPEPSPEAGGCQTAVGGVWWLGMAALIGRRRRT